MEIASGHRLGNPHFVEAAARQRIATARAEVYRLAARSGEKLEADLDKESDSPPPQGLRSLPPIRANSRIASAVRRLGAYSSP